MRIALDTTFAIRFVAFLLLVFAVFAADFAVASDAVWASSGPEGGEVRTVAVDPTDDSLVFAGTIDGVYRSLDGGQTWSRSTTGIGNRVARTIIVNPQRPEQVFALVWFPAEIFRSEDGGETWHSLVSWEHHTSASLQFSSTPFVLYVAVEGAVSQSIDSGTIWAAMTNLPNEAEGFVVHSDHPDFMAVILPTAGVALSEDGGESWANCGGATNQNLIRVLFDPNDPEIMYAQKREFLYRSLDGCRSWEAFQDIRLRNIGFLKADPDRPLTLYADTHFPQQLIVSPDGGQSWRPYGPAADELSVYDMAFSPTNPGLQYLAAEAFDERRGVFRSEDGGAHWEISSDSLFASTIETLSLDPADSTIAYAGAREYGTYSGNGVFKTSDSGTTWSFLEGTEGGGSIVAVDPMSPEIVYATSADWGILKSTDGGDTWFAVWQSSLDRRIGDIEVDHHRAGTLFRVTDEHYHDAHRSNDGGETWVELELPDDADVFGIYSDPHAPGGVYAATWQGLFKSSDWGETWISYSVGFEASEPDSPWGWPWGYYYLVEELVFDATDPDILYAATVVGPFRTMNGGLTWEPVRSGMHICCGPDTQCDGPEKTSGPLTCEGGTLGLAVDPDRPSTVYASTLFGTYRSYNRGENWQLITGPDRALVESLEALDGGLLIGASNTAGVVRLGVSPMPPPRRPGHRVLPEDSTTAKADVAQHHQ